jgi:hypothetical protein
VVSGPVLQFTASEAIRKFTYTEIAVSTYWGGADPHRVHFAETESDGTTALGMRFANAQKVDNDLALAEAGRVSAGSTYFFCQAAGAAARPSPKSFFIDWVVPNTRSLSLS